MRKTFCMSMVFSLLCILVSILIMGAAVANADDEVVFLTPPSEIMKRVNVARPLNGGDIPSDLSSRIGITHYGGRYYFSDEPFLIEGLKAISGMGFRSTKLWLSALNDQTARGYLFNSDWPDFNKSTRLIDIAKIPYFEQAFSMDFDTFMLEVHTSWPMLWREGPDKNASYYADEEQQFYELAKYLLETYADREITFILHNWAGDWLLRGEGGQLDWVKNPNSVPKDINKQIAGMIKWFTALVVTNVLFNCLDPQFLCSCRQYSVESKDFGFCMYVPFSTQDCIIPLVL